jgi:hypothetical protein
MTLPFRFFCGVCFLFAAKEAMQKHRYRKTERSDGKLYPQQQQNAKKK